jgi:WD40 repeat protein
MISESWDKTTRDLKAGEEIEKARAVCEGCVWAVAVSRDGQWAVTGGGESNTKDGELKACEVETGVSVKTFKKHSESINCIDISPDNTLLASGSDDNTARIWNLDTGKLVAGPFKSVDWVGAVRFSPDSKKLAVKSNTGMYLEVWDVQSQKLDVKADVFARTRALTYTPVFWTNNNIISSRNQFHREPEEDDVITIYEFDASTLESRDCRNSLQRAHQLCHRPSTLI